MSFGPQGIRNLAVMGILLGAALCPAEEPADMVGFPAGEFVMGSPEGQGRRDEHPRHTVWLDAFFLDRYEVTGGDFEAFLEAHPKEHPTITGWYDRKVRPDMKDRPVIGLTWERCRRYCAWRGKRLPTEAEWERAAAGLKGRRYPWGESPPDLERANFGRCCFIMKGEALHPVGSLEAGRTPDGVYDLAGNIAEWVADWYDPVYYGVSPYRNPPGPDRGQYHVIRGGAWNSLPDYLRSARRYGEDDGKDYYGIGCRCARSARVTNPDSR